MHVTIGRAKDIRRREAEILTGAVARMAERVFGEWTAPRVELIRSELLPAGPVYTVQATADLAADSECSDIIRPSAG